MIAANLRLRNGVLEAIEVQKLAVAVNQVPRERNRLVVEQGTRMGRPSILQVTLTPEPELTGAGVVVLRGTLRF